jgi:hypothetical protein
MGLEHVVFTSLSLPGLYLMGFKPQSLLKIYYKVKPASFIYPDEKVSIVHAVQIWKGLVVLTALTPVGAVHSVMVFCQSQSLL